MGYACSRRVLLLASAVARSPRIARTPIVGRPGIYSLSSKVASYHERPIIIHTLPNTSVHFPLQSSPGIAIRAWMPASVEGWVWLSIAYLRRAWIKDQAASKVIH